MLGRLSIVAAVTIAVTAISVPTLAGAQKSVNETTAASAPAATDADMRLVLDLLSAGTGAGASCTSKPASAGSACTTGNLCSDLGACSFYGDLFNAEGDKRATYLAEKAQDGLLTPHCGHSIRSLSTLKRLDRRYGPLGVEVVGAFVNTSTIASAKDLAEQRELTYPLWTIAGDALADVLESHLAPTTLLVDEHGKVLEKLVGEKTEAELAGRLDAVLLGEHDDLGMTR